GPINIPASSLPPAPAARPVAPKSQPREITARTNLNGARRFNRDQSDDPDSKIRDAMPSRTNGNGYPQDCDPNGSGYAGGGDPGGGYPPGSGYPRRYPNGGCPGGGYPGGGYPGGGYPGGGYPGGGYPGGGYPNGRSPDFGNNQKIQELIRPANSL